MVLRQGTEARGGTGVLGQVVSRPGSEVEDIHHIGIGLRPNERFRRNGVRDTRYPVAASRRMRRSRQQRLAAVDARDAIEDIHLSTFRTSRLAIFLQAQVTQPDASVVRNHYDGLTIGSV